MYTCTSLAYDYLSKDKKKNDQFNFLKSEISASIKKFNGTIASLKKDYSFCRTSKEKNALAGQIKDLQGRLVSAQNCMWWLKSPEQVPMVQTVWNGGMFCSPEESLRIKADFERKQYEASDEYKKCQIKANILKGISYVAGPAFVFWGPFFVFLFMNGLFASDSVVRAFSQTLAVEGYLFPITLPMGLLMGGWIFPRLIDKFLLGK
ncbi:MAG: hypothetical protein MJ169_04335 [Treponema sp.]|nr:hypothetical protein [Treponema sp.]